MQPPPRLTELWPVDTALRSRRAIDGCGDFYVSVIQYFRLIYSRQALVSRTYRPFTGSQQELATMVMVRLNHITTRHDPRHYQTHADVTLIAPKHGSTEARTNSRIPSQLHNH